MKAVHAVTLDAAGTLIHVRQPVGETYAAIAAAHGIEVQASDIATSFRTVFPRMAPLAFGACEQAQRERQERDWWRTLVRNCLGPHGQHPSFGAFFDALYDYYRGAEAWSVYPEVPEVLDALQAHGIRIAVVSNFDSRLHTLLHAMGLHERFHCVLCSSEAGAAKPDTRIFMLACEALGSVPATTLHAGDDRRADLEGARAAGLGALWVRRGTPHADATPDCIENLRGILARTTAPVV